jgi:hypothetical protein
MRDQVRQARGRGSAPQAVALLCGTIAFIAVAVAALLQQEEPAIAITKGSGAGLAVAAIALFAGCLGMAVLSEKRPVSTPALATEVGSPPAAASPPGTARGGGRTGGPQPGQPAATSTAKGGEAARVRVGAA